MDSPRYFSSLQVDADKLAAAIADKLGKKPDDAYVLLAHLLAEAGEVADQVRALEGNRVRSGGVRAEDLGKEIVDCIYNLMLIANHYHIELDALWGKRLEEIKKKFD